MSDSVPDRVSSINARVSGLLNEADQSLRGERIFGVQQVREFSALLSEMAPVWAQAPALRRSRPELQGELDLYKSLLEELAVTLQRVRFMLLAQRAQLEVRRARFAAVSHWATAMKQTCGIDFR